MITNVFRYEMPRTIQDAVAILAEAPETTTVVGGGTWVVPEMSQHCRKPTAVVELRRAGVGSVTCDGEVTTIGAATTYSEAMASEHTPVMLRTLCEGITGGRQVQGQGTIGGSACYAYPSSDVPGGLVALGATMNIRSASGSRQVPSDEFFVDAFATCLQADELLASIAIDAQVASRPAAHVKFRVAEGSSPIVTASCVADASGAITSVTIGGATTVPFTASIAPDADADRVAAAVRPLITNPWEDVLATGNFRRHVAGVMAWRAVSAARKSTTGEN